MELPAVAGPDSAGLGWNTMHAALFRERPTVDPFVMPASEHPLLVMVTRGNYVIYSRQRTAWRRAVYGPGSVGVTAPGRSTTLRWATVSDEPMESLHIRLGADLIRDTQDSLGTPSSRRSAPDTLRFDWPEVVAACSSVAWGLRGRAPALYADAAAQILALQLLGHGPRTGDRHRRGLAPATLEVVVAYLHAHLADDVTLADLAAEAHLSKHHFLRLFSRSVGTTPYRYLVSMRMEHAAVLLRTTELPVAVVARRCGYASTSQFGAAFTRQHGGSPTAYRSSTAD